MSEVNKDNSEPPLDFVGKFSLNDDSVDVAEDIMKTLKINLAKYDRNSIKRWIERAEENGIFVARTIFIHSHLILDSKLALSCMTIHTNAQDLLVKRTAVIDGFMNALFIENTDATFIVADFMNLLPNKDFPMNKRITIVQHLLDIFISMRTRSPPSIGSKKASMVSS